MKVLFNQAIAGADFYYAKGQVVELPSAAANEFLASGFCEPVVQKKEVKAERATSKKSTKRNTRAK